MKCNASVHFSKVDNSAHVSLCWLKIVLRLISRTKAWAGNSYWRERLSAIDLLIRIGCFVKEKNLVYVWNAADLNWLLNCTDPCPAVRIPWLELRFSFTMTKLEIIIKWSGQTLKFRLCSKVVEQSLHHPKVNGLSPAITAGENGKEVLLRYGRHDTLHYDTQHNNKWNATLRIMVEFCCASVMYAKCFGCWLS